MRQLRKLLTLTVLILALTVGNIGTNSAQAAELSVSQKALATKNYQKSVNTIRWFNSKKHNWRLHKRFKTCYGVKVEYSPKRAGICYKSRLAYKAHTERRDRLKVLLWPELLRPPHYEQWLCIHSHEAAWTNPGLTWDGRPSRYYGGLQMDWDFMNTYGPELVRTKGHAGNWTPLEQMWVAERAWKTRGFYPWPNTARYCGLI